MKSYDGHIWRMLRGAPTNLVRLLVLAVIGLVILLFIGEEGREGTSGGGGQTAIGSIGRGSQIEARVRRIIDGDTFTLSGHSRRIRVWGLDAPERGEIGGTAATNAMRNLISGQTLRCQIRDIDRYGRYVGQCFLPDGRDITAEMIHMGVANEYCYFSRNYYRTCR